jgi:hypothetical protein
VSRGQPTVLHLPRVGWSLPQGRGVHSVSGHRRGLRKAAHRGLPPADRRLHWSLLPRQSRGGRRRAGARRPGQGSPALRGHPGQLPRLSPRRGVLGLRSPPHTQRGARPAGPHGPLCGAATGGHGPGP